MFVQLLQIHFEDVVGEPGVDGPTNSPDCVWLNAHHCYTCLKNTVYRLTSLVFALPVSLLYGYLACASSFCHIWMLTPCHKSVSLACCHGLRLLNGQFWHSCIGPLTRACAQVFWPFRNKRGREQGPKSKGTKVSFNKTVKYKTIPARPNK